MIRKMKKYDIKYDIKELNMNGKTLLTACLMALFGLSGCALFQRAPSEDTVSQVETDVQVCPNGVCETDPFVNYTETRADYREYGELSERDIIVSQSGAGNNLSAAVPPSIEDEVIEYEEQVENAALQAEDAAAEAAQNAADVASVQNAAELPVQVEETVEVVTPASVSQNDGTSSDTVNTAVNENTTEEAAATEAETTVAENTAGEENTSTEEDEEDPVRDWYAEEGQNLKALLTEWSGQSGWRLVWNTNRNYVLNAGAMFRGRFADVSSALIRAFARARPAPVATFYKGNRVLVVETMEDENAYD